MSRRRAQIHVQTTCQRPSPCSEGPLAFVAGRDLNPRPLGYEQYDSRLRRLAESLGGGVTSADWTDHVALGRLRLPRLARFHRVRFTNWFTEQPLDLRFPVPFQSPRGGYPAAGSNDGEKGGEHHGDPTASRSGPQGAQATEDRKRRGSIKSSERSFGPSPGLACRPSYQVAICWRRSAAGTRAASLKSGRSTV